VWHFCPQKSDIWSFEVQYLPEVKITSIVDNALG
jgi:hypothetical protein